MRFFSPVFRDNLYVINNVYGLTPPGEAKNVNPAHDQGCDQQYVPEYGDLSELNTQRTILDAVGKDELNRIASDFVDVLHSSLAVYERNGDYALGIFSAQWCRLLDRASRELCDTSDNSIALASGKWLCHESCWTCASKRSIEQGREIDIECCGGLHLFAVPIIADGEAIGSINFAYGKPPLDEERLASIAERFRIDRDLLRDTASHHPFSDDHTIALSKRRLQTAAKLIGKIVESRHSKEMQTYSERRYKELFQNSYDGIVITDLKGRFLECNDAYLQILGYDSFDEIRNKSYEEMTPQEYHDLERKIIREQTLARGYCDEYEKEYIRKPGKRIAVSLRAWLLNDNMCVVVRGITMRKKLTEDLQKTQRLESLGLLAGGIAHDFNNLLGGIFGNIDLAIDQTKNPHVAGHLSRALSAIDRARGLTGQLLTFAKGGAPLRKLESLAPFLEKTSRFALSGSKLSCEYDIAADLWPCEFDRNQIGQVIDNILINAQQAMPEGGIIQIAADNLHLEESAHPPLPAGDYVRVGITDHGTGIPKEIRTKIFDPFFTTKPKGHGLGLAISHSIVKRHGGVLDVKSEPGKGSTFTVYLPASPSLSAPAKKEQTHSHKGSGSVIVMDDEELILDIVSAMLGSMEYAVHCTSNANETLELFQRIKESSGQLSAVILDLTISGGRGGKDIVGEIRQLAPKLPVFVASGYADDPVMADPVSYGFTGSICKPFRKTELAELMRTHVGKS